MNPRSRQAYLKHIASGKALYQWHRVYRHIETTPGCTRSEIERDLKIKLSSVTGRVKELIDAQMIDDYGERKCSVTGENVGCLYVVEPKQYRLAV